MVWQLGVWGLESLERWVGWGGAEGVKSWEETLAKRGGKAAKLTSHPFNHTPENSWPTLLLLIWLHFFRWRGCFFFFKSVSLSFLALHCKHVAPLHQPMPNLMTLYTLVHSTPAAPLPVLLAKSNYKHKFQLQSTCRSSLCLHFCSNSTRHSLNMPSKRTAMYQKSNSC